MINSFLLKIKSFLQIDQYLFFSFVFLLILTLLFYKLKSEEKKKNLFYFILLLSILVFIIWSFVLSFWQYLIWKNNSFSKYLLPPYQNINYFLNYVYFHFWRDLFFRILSLFLILIFLKIINFIFKRDIFYDDEKILIIQLALFFVFPINILFVYFSFFLLLLIIGASIIIKKIPLNMKYSFKNYWLITAWIILLIEPLLINNNYFLKFKP